MSSKRLVVAAVILPVFFAYVYLLPAFPYFLALLLCAGILAMRELYVMYKLPQKMYFPGLLIGGLLLYISCRAPAHFIEGVVLGLFLLLLFRLFAGKPGGSMSDIGSLGVGIFYISVFLSFQWFLRTEPFGKQYILLLYFSVWAADSMAYYIGTYIGKNKLYPDVSPNKTFEGAVGSIIGGGLGSVMIKAVFNISDLTIMDALVIGAILGIATVIGDLIESMFKRDAGVKDSGSLIPGHGGLLDKLDGVIVAGPTLYFILRYIR